MKIKKKILIIIGILISIIFISNLIPPILNPMDLRLDGVSANKGIFIWLKWTILERMKINEKLLPVYEKPIKIPDPVPLCENISWLPQRYTCLALVKKDEKICNKIDNSEYRDICYLDVKEMKKSYSPLVCEETETAIGKSKCYERLAVITKDPSWCEKANSIGPCFLEVAIASKNISFCEKIEDRYYKNAACYIAVAEKTKDFSICEKIEKNGYIGRNAPAGTTVNDLINICYQRVRNSIAKEKAKSENNPFFCKMMKSTNEAWDIREDCYYEIAVKKKDISICKKIKDECKQAECIGVIKNPYACERCTNKGCCGIFSYRQACYNKAAISLEDPRFCGNAGEGDLKDDCYFQLALKLTR